MRTRGRSPLCEAACGIARTNAPTVLIDAGRVLSSVDPDKFGSQLRLLNLAGCGLWHCLGENNAFRAFERAEMTPHFLQKGLFIDRMPSFENDDCCHRFAPAIMRSSNHRMPSLSKWPESPE